MYKYYNPLQSQSGDALAGYLVRLFAANGDAVDIFADEGGTPIVTQSEVANAAMSDELGMVRFYVANGTYDLRIYDATDTFKSAETAIPMVDASGVYTDLSGNDGATLVGTPAGTVQAELDSRPTTAVLAAPTGGEMVGFSHDAANVGDTVGQRLKQEIWVTDAPFNADPTGVSDASGPFQDAINALQARGGGTLRGRGVFKVASLEWPAEPAVINFRGEGFAATKLVQATADTPVIKKVSGVSRIVGAQLIDFTVQAHAASDKTDPANILIDIAGFDSAIIRVAYRSDAAATASVGCAYAVISGHANNGVCYRNSIFLKMQATAGPEKGIWLHNGGAGTSLANANCNEVSLWCYALSNLGAAVDGANTTQMVVKFSLFEDCPGATGVVAGNFTVTRNNWFELMDVSINYGTTSDTVANNCVSISDQFSGSNTIVIHSSIAGPPRFNDPLIGGMTFENQSGAATTNYVSPTVSKTQPSTLGASFVFGGGALTPDAADWPLHIDHHGVTTAQYRWFVTPASGVAVLRLVPPTGFAVEQAHISATESGLAPLIFGLSNATNGNDWQVFFPNTNSHTINARVTLRAV